jgi:hypothetical protein
VVFAILNLYHAIRPTIKTITLLIIRLLPKSSFSKGFKFMLTPVLFRCGKYKILGMPELLKCYFWIR